MVAVSICFERSGSSGESEVRALQMGAVGMADGPDTEQLASELLRCCVLM